MASSCFERPGHARFACCVTAGFLVHSKRKEAACVSREVDYRSGSFFAANHHDALSGREGGNHRQSRANSFMNANLIAAASQVIPSAELLVNVVSRRVRQLSVGHRPMVQTAPGTLAADIALAEIIGGKLTWRPAVPADETEADVVPFPGVMLSGKKAA